MSHYHLANAVIPLRSRLTTLDVLGSLPEPEETAQTMVIRQSSDASKATQRRRGSISHYIKKKFSTRKKNKESSSSISYNVSNLDEAIQPELKKKKNRVSINVSTVCTRYKGIHTYIPLN